MSTFMNALKRMWPHFKKVLPLLGTGLISAIGGFFVGSKRERKRCEKKYSRVCAELVKLSEKVTRLEAENAPMRKIKRARRELEEEKAAKAGLKEKLESLRREV